MQARYAVEHGSAPYVSCRQIELAFNMQSCMVRALESQPHASHGIKVSIAGNGNAQGVALPQVDPRGSQGSHSWQSVILGK